MVKRKKQPQTRDIIRRALVNTHRVDPRQPKSRETWLQGVVKNTEHEIDIRLDHGAQQGHAELSLMVDIDGKRVAWEYIDMTTLIENWATKIVDEELKRRDQTASELDD